MFNIETPSSFLIPHVKKKGEDAKDRPTCIRERLAGWPTGPRKYIPATPPICTYVSKKVDLVDPYPIDISQTFQLSVTM